MAAWIHGGDYCDDGEDLAIYTGVPVYAVLGNNDYLNHTNDPECRCVTVGGIRIVAIHGSQWYGERRLQKLIELGREQQANLVVFGHTPTGALSSVRGTCGSSIPEASACPATGEKGPMPS